MNIQEIQKQQYKMIDKIRFKNRTAKNGAYNTTRKYKTVFNNFNNYIKSNNIQEITQNNISDILEQYQQQYLNNYLTKDKKKLSNNTINQYMIIVRKLFKVGCNMEIKNMDLLKTTATQPKYINLEQYQAIQKYLELMQQQSKTQHQRMMHKTDAIIINLLFNTGLRIHEALKITIDELTKATNDKNNIHQLDIIGKGNKQRTIFIPADTYNLLMQFIETYARDEQTYIFESNKTPGKPITTRTINRRFNNIAVALDEQENIDSTDEHSYSNLLKPHNLRHSFAVVKLDAGLQINAMQKLLGHSNITTTQIYTNLNNDSLSDAVARTF